MLKIVRISELQAGMYVTQVTKQVNDVKLTSQGLLKDQQHIDSLRAKGIIAVEIDLSKGSYQEPADESTLPVFEIDSSITFSYSEQMQNTMQLYEQARGALERSIGNIIKRKMPDIDSIKNLSEDIVERVFECEDTISVITQIKQIDKYQLEHSVNVCILITMLGRRLGMEKQELYNIGVGALLMNIGMAKLPLLLVQKISTLSEKERQKIQSHVDLSVDAIYHLDTISETTFNVIRQHHERIDGSGYPYALAADAISLEGQMAGIVDTYDALTTDRPYRKAMSATQALNYMKNDCAGQFDPTILAEFTRCLGLYPVGSVVKLSSDVLAVVLKINPEWPDRPIVMGFYDLKADVNMGIKQIDLSTSSDEIVDSVVADDGKFNLLNFLKQAFVRR